MAFSLSRRSIPSISSYADALKFYEGSKPWRDGRNGCERKLNLKSSKDHWGVRLLRKTGMDALAFRYHCTDVVTWFEDNTFFIDPYSSMSTSIFADGLTPSGLWFRMTDSHGYLVRTARHNPAHEHSDDEPYWLNERFYYIKGSGAGFALDPETWTWLPTSGVDPISWPKPRQPDAKAALKAHKFYEFQNYVAAALCIAKPTKATHGAHGEHNDLALELSDRRHAAWRIVDTLDSPNLWMAMLKSPSFWPEEDSYRKVWGRDLVYTTSCHARRIIDAARTAIYLHCDVIEDREYQFLTSHNQLASAAAARSRFERY